MSPEPIEDPKLSQSPRLLHVALGISTSLFLFWVMQALIGMPAVVMTESPAPVVKFERIIRDTLPPSKPVEPLEKPEPLPEPPTTPFDMSPISPGGTLNVEPMGEFDAREFAEEAGPMGGSESAPIPLVRVEPDYPPHARRAGIEGHVVLAFAITSTGSVDDVEVISASPPHTFERAAVRAVRKWRYAPSASTERSTRENPLVVRVEFELPAGDRR